MAAALQPISKSFCNPDNSYIIYIWTRISVPLPAESFKKLVLAGKKLKYPE